MSDAPAPNPQNQPTLPLESPGQKTTASAMPKSSRESWAGNESFEGKQFGEYEILKELGRGGMGVVYKAKQKKLERVVALKMIIGGRLASEDDLQRFLTEAEAAARLQHKHIVTVHEVGEIDGRHYFSMEYIDGETLAQMLDDGPLSSRRAAKYMTTIARALHFAHEHGFLHRDLKPSNIMVDRQDEPLIMDFGLAKRVGESSGQTQTGTVLGTPSYMSPEQASGRVKEVGPAADIYGLGAVLYELLTGKPPFQSETPLDTLLHVLQSEPVPPRLLNRKVDVDLETICLKCLEKDPKNRYASAEELARDLERYLRGESITARSFNMLDRLSRTLGRGHHDAAFHTWGTMLFWLAGIIFVEHLVVFLLAWNEAPDIWLILARFSQFVVLGIIFWYNRKKQLLPRTLAERELWTIWIGYLIAYAAAFVVVRSLISQGMLTASNAALTKWENLILYPISSLLSGLAFFVMGCNYWGRCYAIGLSFMAVAALSTLDVRWAPLEFGVLWAVALISLGLRMRYLEERSEKPLPPTFAETKTHIKGPH